MTKSQPASQPISIRRHRKDPGIDHSDLLDREINRLRVHLRESSLPPGESPTLIDAAAILCSISFSLLDLTQLLQTHQALQSAGEPVAAYLEQALTGIAQDLQAMNPHGQSPT